MRLITIEDIRDLYIKSAQRGYKFIFSKLSISGKKRTKSSFNVTDTDGSDWWTIPKVRERWNHLITGDSSISYEKYFSEKYCDGQAVKMISVGSGICSHEMEFARLNPGWKITCIDFSEKLMQAAAKVAEQEGLTNVEFIIEDIYNHTFPDDYYNIVLFNSSLHHFKNLDDLIGKVHRSMAPDGKLIINEYTGANRFQYSKSQLKEINKCLGLIDKEYRKIFKTKLYKNRYWGSGIFRMLISDPSECVESESILSTISCYFKTLEEKGYGGNLLMPALKSISHHFQKPDAGKEICINNVFKYEDEYLMSNRSDFVFGVYEKS